MCSLVLSLAVSLASGGEIVVRNLGLACTGDVVLSGPWLGVLVDEAAASGLDRNGDGDAEDFVLHVVDTHGLGVVNTRIATRIPTVLADGAVFVVIATEAASGWDLNGDGDELDAVPVAYDAEAGETRSTRLAKSNRPLVLGGGRLFLSVREGDQGGTDLNGDGDAQDDVVGWMDLATGARAVIPLATIRDVVPFGDHVAVEVRERDQGDLDLNGNGETGDEVLHVVRLPDGATTNLGQATIGAIDVGGGLLVYRASEFSNGVDYDGDGQITFVGVLHVYDARTGDVQNVGRAGTFYAASPEIEGLLFFAQDGGGFPPWPVLALDAAAGTVQPLGIDTRQPLVAWQTFVVAPSQQSEPAEVAEALTGERWTLDTEYYFVRFEDGVVTGYQGNPQGSFRAFELFPPREQILAGNTFSGLHAYDRAGALTAWIQNEVSIQMDLNGDGDQIDAMLRVYDPVGDRVRADDLAVRGFSPRQFGVEPARLAFLASEPSEGSTDLNGDGDALDSVLYLAHLHFHEPRAQAYGEGVRGWREHVPRVEVLGVAASPRELVVQVRRALPGALGVLVVGLEPGGVPLFGGRLLVAAPFAAVAPFTPAALGLDGLARVSLGALPPELAGTSLYLQAAVVDPSAAGGVALSAGLRLVVGG